MKKDLIKNIVVELENEGFDVVKLNVRNNSILEKINKDLSELPNIEQFPKFKKIFYLIVLVGPWGVGKAMPIITVIKKIIVN